MSWVILDSGCLDLSNWRNVFSAVALSLDSTLVPFFRG
ncbi:hypothetical protein RSAG8_00960, partial [Rhizoctonia solani AG-8 WAC10335]